MVLFNYATRELTAKIVYYGPGLCGKTTNLEYIHKSLPEKSRGKMLSLATQTDRTLFFDFLPIDLGSVKGMKTRVQLYTVPGQVFYDATRKLVLKGADGIVFVADSQKEMLDSNLESWENLKTNLTENSLEIHNIPVVLQYNKRDLPNVMSIKELNQKINEVGAPYFEAVALKGKGVQETLKGIAKVVLESLSQKYTKEGKEAKEREIKEAAKNDAAKSASSLGSIIDDVEELVEDLPGPGSAVAGTDQVEEFVELEEVQELKAEASAAKAAQAAAPAPPPPAPAKKKSVEKTMEVKKSDLPAELLSMSMESPEPVPQPVDAHASISMPVAHEAHVSMAQDSSVHVPVELSIGTGEQVVRLQISIDLKIHIVPKP